MEFYLINEVSRAVEQLLSRASGPFHIRLLIQPIISISLAIRAGLRDAREGNPPFLWELVKNTKKRKRLTKTAWKDVGTLAIVALSLDTLYQLIVLKTFYWLQAIIVMFFLAFLPYLILRGLVTRWARRCPLYH